MGIPLSADDLTVLLSAHPALVDSVFRWRGVGGWGATATVLRAIEVGAISIGLKRNSLSLQLVPGVASPKRPHPRGPFVEHGHVAGLSGFDRQLLTMLFDDVAHAPATEIRRLAEFRRAHPLEFWIRLKEWRVAVDSEAKRLQSCGRMPLTRRRIEEARGQIVDALFDESRSDREWSRIAGMAVVANLDDVVAKTAEGRLGDYAGESAAGPNGVVWLACLRSGKRSGVDVLRRLFSPLHPSSYPPAQYTTLVLPPHRRPRIIDDGSLRLGG